ncbi:2'-5' RNA ligase family protein [Dactylosporangium cerinum]|uniref:2'-5' RNA ligase family protein n=1 Tax=Dactylosporangium cerinum TaxID=1434730 RepID=A0ABV9W1H5_9ACTN
MNDAGNERLPTAHHATAAAELERFRSIRQLRDHWTSRHTEPAYYWYLTFEHSTAVHLLAKHCQDNIPLSYYDFTPSEDLHMTLDRVAFVREAIPDRIRAITAAAIANCAGVPPFNIAIGGLGGTPGALGFIAFPPEPLQHLRDALRAATLSVDPGAPVKDQSFHPHVAIGYCNATVPAQPAITAVERLHHLATTSVLVDHVTLVLLEQQNRGYKWRAVTHLPIGPTSEPPVTNRCSPD